MKLAKQLLFLDSRVRFIAGVESARRWRRGFAGEKGRRWVSYRTESDAGLSAVKKKNKKKEGRNYHYDRAACCGGNQAKKKKKGTN